MIDFAPYRRGEQTLQQLVDGLGLGRDDLARLTEEMCDAQLRLLDEARDPDAVFVPDDPDADDRFATDPAEARLPWTLGHVVVHTTASSEEAAAHALTLARGVEVQGRARYEVPWRQAGSAGFLRDRVRESRRMRLAMLAAWPDRPDLETSYAAREGRPTQNAIARFVAGLAHDDSHLEQIGKILSQARAARTG